MPDAETLTLADFLLARIAEDEAQIQTWVNRAVLWPHEGHDVGECDECDHRREHRALDDAVAERLLAECEAKRRIVQEYQDAEAHYRAETALDAHDYGDDGPRYFREIGDQWEMAVKLIALPYAEHADYRAEWKP